MALYDYPSSKFRPGDRVVIRPDWNIPGLFEVVVRRFCEDDCWYYQVRDLEGINKPLRWVKEEDVRIK